ncbi:MAG TPA: cytochrome b N-terminal domain-containing protein [Anaerolineae bacterium]|nr:cytochrome b N-terminal domain-containing protein [Anaerolineae bacterium]
MEARALKLWEEEQTRVRRPRRGGRSRVGATANSLILHLHPHRVPAGALRFSYTWGLGGLSAVLALCLGLTGILLMFRYEPTIDRAYSSIQALEAQVAFGSLVRGIHHWSANLLVVTVFLHLIRVFLTGGFKAGRALNWLVGTLLLLLVLIFNFTGYLLPWDQLAYWAITVSSSLIAYVPLVGQGLSRLVLAGPEVGQGALSNFYALHVAVLPALAAATLGYHFWRVRKDGGISRPATEGAPAERLVSTIPHLVQRELAAATVLLVLVVVWAMLLPAPLGDIANPAHPPNPAKAAWYFGGVQELLLHMHPLAAIALAFAVLAGAALLPFADRQAQDIGLYFRSVRGRRAAVLGAVLALDLVPVLVILDEFWLDVTAWLPTAPVLVSTGLLPLVASLAGLAAVYGLCRLVLRAKHGEALVGLFAFVVIALVVLTIVGVFFRGANMALALPF